MPRDVSIPNPQKYELEDQKEVIVRFDEVPMAAVGVRYEGLGITNEVAGQSEEMRISNDAVRYSEIGILNKAMQ